MKQRNIMAVLLLSIITLGIYDLFWLVSVKKELNAKTKVHIPTLWLLFAPILLLVATVIIMFTVSASTSGSLGESSREGLNILVILVDMFAILVILPVAFYWFFKFSKAVSEYTNGAMSTAVSFLLLFLLRFVGLALIQDHFNDMLSGKVQPGAVGSGEATPAMQPVFQQAPSPASTMPSQVSQPPLTPTDTPMAPTIHTPPSNNAPTAPPTPPVNPVS